MLVTSANQMIATSFRLISVIITGKCGIGPKIGQTRVSFEYIESVDKMQKYSELKWMNGKNDNLFFFVLNNFFFSFYLFISFHSWS